MQVRLEDLDEVGASVAPAWLTLLERSAEDPRDLDITTTYEWSDALRQSHLGEPGARLALARAGADIVGLFPYYRRTQRVRGLPCRQLHAISQFYSGRNRLVAQDPAGFAEALFETLAVEETAWDWLTLTVSDDSPSHRAIVAAARSRGYGVESGIPVESPYIDLPASWDQCFEALPKKFRWLLRSSRKRMEELGRLEHRVCCDPADVDAFFAAVYAIEKASWKEESGSSITLNATQQSFYETFARAAARRGWLRGHLLLLDDEPVAYIFGVRLGPVFHDLKESYKQSMREHSPGHVLKTFALPMLIDEGITRYDFRGKCDDYKMKWTALTYRRRELVIESRTPRAQLLRLLGRLRAWFRGPSPAVPDASVSA